MTFFTQLYQQVLRDPPFFEETWESKTSARNLVFLDNQFHYIQLEHSVLKSNKKVSLAIFHTVLKLEFAKFTNNQSGFLFGNETFLSDFQPWWTSILRWYYYLVSVIIFFLWKYPLAKKPFYHTILAYCWQSVSNQQPRDSWCSISKLTLPFEYLNHYLSYFQHMENLLENEANMLFSLKVFFSQVSFP